MIYILSDLLNNVLLINEKQTENLQNERRLNAISLKMLYVIYVVLIQINTLLRRCLENTDKKLLV